MSSTIPIEVKKQCCYMREQGLTNRKIYEFYVEQVEHPMTFRSFSTCIKRWTRKIYPDSLTLDSGTYEGFVAHDATVQVSANGEIVQAWIKQKASEINVEDFIKAIKENVEPYVYEQKTKAYSSRMLEIPLFDMHWGIAYYDYYEPILEEILQLINSRRWEKIVIPFGQDFFHNDSIVNGQTTKGTEIEKVDMVKAVKDGKKFIYAIIDEAIKNADEVRVLYTPGNHDKSISWMFVQVLLERYGSIVDDSIENRKCITYGNNSIMVTHGNSKKATMKNLAHIFPISFPESFGSATVREVHAGHLHEEADGDIYGVMVRRLSSGGKIDEWSDSEDYLGSHRRFMIFEWGLDKLKSIHYI